MHALYHVTCGSLAAITFVMSACNSVLGVADVAPEPDAKLPGPGPTRDAAPDADRSACKLDARYPLITMSSSTASLSRTADGSPSLFIGLNDDGLLITLHDNKGQHGTLQAFGVYQLTNSDSKLETCGICVLLGANFNATTKTYAQEYVASMHGQLQIATATSTQLIGSMQDLVVRHVNLDTSTRTTTDAVDGCTTVIDEIDFSLTYSAATAGLPAMHALLGR